MRRWVLALLCLAATAPSLVAACGNVNAHVFEGEQYMPNGCLSGGLAIAVVNGDNAVPGCAPVCFVFPDDGGVDGVDTYVSSECPPYPYVSDAGVGQCAAALAAFEAGYFCEEDGAVPPGDAPAPHLSDAGGGADANPVGDADSADAGAD